MVEITMVIYIFNLHLISTYYFSYPHFEIWGRYLQRKLAKTISRSLPHQETNATVGSWELYLFIANHDICRLVKATFGQVY